MCRAGASLSQSCVAAHVTGGLAPQQRQVKARADLKQDRRVVPPAQQLQPSAAGDMRLARAAVQVSHGGAGTVAAALAQGAPQVACPLRFDQPFWVRRAGSQRVQLRAWGGLASKHEKRAGAHQAQSSTMLGIASAGCSRLRRMRG